MPDNALRIDAPPTPRQAMEASWSAHRDAFRVEPFVAGETRGTSVFDGTQTPPSWWLLATGVDGKPFCFAGDLARGEAVPDDVSAFAVSVHARAAAIAPKALDESMPLTEALRFMGAMPDRSPLADLSVHRFRESLEDAATAALLPLAGLIKSETSRIDRAGLIEARTGLDVGAMQALASVPEFLWRDYAFYAERGERGDVRRQAAGIYPLLAAFMAGRPALRAAVDARKSLPEALQDAFGRGEDGKPRVEKSVISRLAGVTWPTGGISVDRLIRLMAKIPRDWVPTKDRGDWDAFCDVAATIAPILSDGTGLSMETLCAGAAGKWQDFRSRLAKGFSDTRPPEGTTREEAAAIHAAIDWKGIGKYPPDKIQGAATANVRTFSDDLPAHVGEDDVVDWIVRVLAPDASRERLAMACEESEQMLDAFASKVLLPLVALENGVPDAFLSEVIRLEARSVASDVLFAGKSAKAIFEDVRHFQAQHDLIMAAGTPEDPADAEEEGLDEEARQALEAERAAAREAAMLARQAKAAASLTALGIPTETPPDGWAAMTLPWQAPNGIWVVPLTSRALLEMESKGWGALNLENGLPVPPTRMNQDGTLGLAHCVACGIYERKCRTGLSHILALRVPSADGTTFERVSTVEVGGVARGRRTIECGQHMAEYNHSAPEKAVKALAAYCKAIETGELDIDYDGIADSVARNANRVAFDDLLEPRFPGAIAARHRRDDIKSDCGYEWRDYANVAKAMRPWLKYVGKRFRKMDLVEFARSPEVYPLARELDPSLPETPPVPQMLPIAGP